MECLLVFFLELQKFVNKRNCGPLFSQKSATFNLHGHYKIKFLISKPFNFVTGKSVYEYKKMCNYFCVIEDSYRMF